MSQFLVKVFLILSLTWLNLVCFLVNLCINSAWHTLTEVGFMINKECLALTKEFIQ